MYLYHLEQNFKRLDENSESNADRAARRIAERFALTVPVAITIAQLAGLGGEREARS
jgi:hypothetical protein